MKWGGATRPGKDIFLDYPKAAETSLSNMGLWFLWPRNRNSDQVSCGVKLQVRIIVRPCFMKGARAIPRSSTEVTENP